MNWCISIRSSTMLNHFTGAVCRALLPVTNLFRHKHCRLASCSCHSSRWHRSKRPLCHLGCPDIFKPYIILQCPSLERFKECHSIPLKEAYDPSFLILLSDSNQVAAQWLHLIPQTPTEYNYLYALTRTAISWVSLRQIYLHTACHKEALTT